MADTSYLSRPLLESCHRAHAWSKETITPILWPGAPRDALTHYLKVSP